MSVRGLEQDDCSKTSTLTDNFGNYSKHYNISVQWTPVYYNSETFSILQITHTHTHTQ